MTNRYNERIKRKRKRAKNLRRKARVRQGIKPTTNQPKNGKK